MEKHFPIHLLGVSKLYRTFSLDLRKPCCKLVKACLLNKYWFCYREKKCLLHHRSRMRSLHLHIRSEYGIENVILFWRWERLECNMVDFHNHKRFSLRCQSSDLIPISIRLKSNIKTPKGMSIIRRAERSLLNERIMSINNTITMLGLQQDTCINKPSSIMNKEIMEECTTFIKLRREARHNNTFERQTAK